MFWIKLTDVEDERSKQLVPKVALDGTGGRVHITDDIDRH
jgi:hypothetical protein